MTQYEIEKTIHDRLVILCDYKETENAHNAYGALVNGTAVCEELQKHSSTSAVRWGLKRCLYSGNPTIPLRECGRTLLEHCKN